MLEACLEVVGWRRLSEVGGEMLQRERIALAVRVARAVAREHDQGRVVGRLDPESVRVWRARVSLRPDTKRPVAAAFVAPEVRVGAEPSRASDVYALGCLAFQLIGGRRPPRHFDRASLWAALRHGWSWTGPLIGALEPDPDRRYADAEVFAQALERLLPEPAVESVPTPTSTRDRRITAAAWGFGGVTVIASIYGGAVAAAATLAAMASLVWWFGQRREKPSMVTGTRPDAVVQAAPSRLASNSSR